MSDELKTKVRLSLEKEMIFKCDLGSMKVKDCYIDDTNKDEVDMLGPNPTRMLALALLGCLSASFIFCLKKKNLTLDDLKAAPFDLVIIIDTNSCSQLPNFEQYLKNNRKPVLVIDHHVTSDGLGDVELIDSTSAATGEIVLELLKYADWPVNQKAAEALFVAVSNDTGWFRFGNTTSRTLRIAAELVDAGADPTGIYRKIYQSLSPARFGLMTAMLGTL